MQTNLYNSEAFKALQLTLTIPSPLFSTDDRVTFIPQRIP